MKNLKYEIEEQIYGQLWDKIHHLYWDTFYIPVWRLTAIKVRHQVYNRLREQLRE